MKYILLFLISFAINQAAYAGKYPDDARRVVKEEGKANPFNENDVDLVEEDGKADPFNEVDQLPKKGKMGLIRSLSFSNPFTAIENDVDLVEEEGKANPFNEVDQLSKKGKMGFVRSLSLPNPFMAIENGKIENVKKYIQKGGLDYDRYGYFRGLRAYPLLAAVIAQNIEIIQLLAEAEATYEDKSNLTQALSYLFQIILVNADTKTEMKKIEQIAKILIDSGADVNYQAVMQIGSRSILRAGFADNGWTNLHHVILHSDNANLVKMLIEAGADLNIEIYNDGTPLQYARERNRTEIIKVLKRAKSIKKACAGAF